jgi:hypothetical protein
MTRTNRERITFFGTLHLVILCVLPPPSVLSSLSLCLTGTDNIPPTRNHTDLNNKNDKKKEWIQHHTVPGWSPTPVLSGLKPR